MSPDLLALLLSRIQFGFTVSFQIIFPAFTIGLAAWLAFLEGLHLATGRPAYRRLFDFWLRIFAVAFGLGVVSGIVMAFEFVIFLAAFATLAASFLPYIVPFSLTISEAAAPTSSLSFVFWGAGIVVLPLTLIYTVMVYTVFKGKISPTAEYH